MIKKRFNIPIYDKNFTVYIAEDFTKATEKFNIELDENFLQANALAFTDDISYCVLFKPDASIGVLAHECFHILNYICIHIGINPDMENDESRAYLLGFLMDKTKLAFDAYKQKSPKNQEK